MNATTPHGPKDSLREVVETIVFVVALVLMLKLFIVEAFVIPTGSMAETLFGYQKQIPCVDCGYVFAVNSSDEVESQDGQRHLINGGTCPNCRRQQQWKPAENPYQGGDRVLVHKALYTLGSGPKRGDVVVFKFPVDPQLSYTAQNYIKRLWGLGGETIAIFQGNLYVSTDINYPAEETNSFGQPRYPRPAPGQLERAWEGPMPDSTTRTSPPFRSLGIDFTYHNTDPAITAFRQQRDNGFQAKPNQPQFRLIRKTDAQLFAMRRLVYDNQFQSKYLSSKGVPARWTPETGWKGTPEVQPKTFTHSGTGPARLNYQHRVSAPATQWKQPNGDLVRDNNGFPIYIDDWKKVEAGYSEGLFPPSAITNFLGYNTSEESGARRRMTGDYTVGDLMLETTATLQADAELALELCQGKNRYQARFQPGKVQFVIDDVVRGEVPCPVVAGRSSQLAFANFDGELRVWVDGRRIEPAGFSPEFVPTEVGAFQPTDPPAAALVAKGSVTATDLVLWMDTYFTPAANDGVNYQLLGLTLDTFYVQPGHYLCLGDNSGQSSDSRKWGLVPERLMLGQAQFIFFPLNRLGRIH